MSENIKHLDQVGFNEFIKSGKVLVDFWATWCGPCMRQGKMIEDAADADPDFASRVAKVNVDDERELAVSLGISAIPTLIVFADGKELSRFVGMQDIDTLKNALK